MSYQIGEFIGRLIAWPLLGAVVGLVPFILSIKRGQRTLGFVSVLFCAAMAFQFRLVGIGIALVISLVLLFLLRK